MAWYVYNGLVWVTFDTVCILTFISVYGALGRPGGTVPGGLGGGGYGTGPVGYGTGTVGTGTGSTFLHFCTTFFYL